MTADYLIDKEQLEDHGVTIKLATHENGRTSYNYYALNFPGYNYMKEGDLVDGNISICASGTFRDWLENFLETNNIIYEVF